MAMKIIKTENRLCSCCMEEHDVKTVLVKERVDFKELSVAYDAAYFFCEKADEYFADEIQMQKNDIKMKDAYREKAGLLTSVQISNIRAKYGISQSDLCRLLGWGGKTITRYESHQVQDKAHDSILKKLDSDPEWFVYLLKEARLELSRDPYEKYLKTAQALYTDYQDSYLRKSIEAIYASYEGKNMLNGNTTLSLDKVVDMIRYFASNRNVTSLYKVKLMKLMWYADSLAYKSRGFAITGLVYQSLPMGAVPVGHDLIIDLKGIPCEEVDYGDGTAYHFYIDEKPNITSLTPEEKGYVDIVIKNLGKKTKDEIVSFMHNEKAYIETLPRDVINFKYAEDLQILT